LLVTVIGLDKGKFPSPWRTSF